MSSSSRAWLVNSIIVLGLLLEKWRGAPWTAIAITAGIALPMVNGMMFWKRKQLARGIR